jgi:hypothetical protein
LSNAKHLQTCHKRLERERERERERGRERKRKREEERERERVTSIRGGKSEGRDAGRSGAEGVIAYQLCAEREVRLGMAFGGRGVNPAGSNDPTRDRNGCNGNA